MNGVSVKKDVKLPNGDVFKAINIIGWVLIGIGCLFLFIAFIWKDVPTHRIEDINFLDKSESIISDFYKTLKIIYGFASALIGIVFLGIAEIGKTVLINTEIN